MAQSCWLVMVVGWLVWSDSRAETIRWFSVVGSNNITAAGSAMSGTFRFELGVFNGSFVPTAANAAQWTANWVPAQRVSYNGPNKRFDGQFTVASSAPPFTVGKAAYVWGFQDGATSSEWILFRNPGWTWPAPNPMNPFGVDWDAASATAVIGSVEEDGSPFLMKSVTLTTWQQWRDITLASEPFNAPNDDPDQDGVSNLLEFAFGTPPKLAGAPATALEIVTSNSQQFLQLTIPRQLDHLVILTPQVSSDLKNWAESQSEVNTSPDAPALVIRDLTPLGPSAKHFMRLKAELPTR